MQVNLEVFIFGWENQYIEYSDFSENPMNILSYPSNYLFNYVRYIAFNCDSSDFRKREFALLHNMRNSVFISNLFSLICEYYAVELS